MQGILEHTYEIKSQLGSGGCGNVYKAWHKRLNKYLVLKELKNSSGRSAGELRNEIEALKNIKSMYVPQVFDYLTEDNFSYTVMEYVEGVSFDKLLASRAGFTSSQIARWYCQLATALETLHKNNICHRDIKPGNIIRTHSGDACLIDFNNALVSGNKTRVVGRSVCYCSPEQYEYFQICENAHAQRKSGKPASAAHPDYKLRLQSLNIDWKLSDIYSLGATMYHLFTGNRPHKGIHAQSGTVLHLQDGLDKKIWSAIKRSTRPDPAHRYTSASELRMELEDCQRHTYIAD